MKDAKDFVSIKLNDHLNTCELEAKTSGDFVLTDLNMQKASNVAAHIFEQWKQGKIGVLRNENTFEWFFFNEDGNRLDVDLTTRYSVCDLITEHNKEEQTKRANDAWQNH